MVSLYHLMSARRASDESPTAADLATEVTSLQAENSALKSQVDWLERQLNGCWKELLYRVKHFEGHRSIHWVSRSHPSFDELWGNGPPDSGNLYTLSSTPQNVYAFLKW